MLLLVELKNIKLCLRLEFSVKYFPVRVCIPAAGHRMWALQRLRKLLTTEYGQSININRLLGDGEGEARSVVSPLNINPHIQQALSISFKWTT